MASCEISHSFQVSFQVLEISHLGPNFVTLHLQRSPKNADILVTSQVDDLTCCGPCSICSLIENPSSTINQDGRYLLKYKHKVYGSVNGLVSYWVCGSINGLVCLHGELREVTCEWAEYWVCFWNPATR